MEKLIGTLCIHKDADRLGIGLIPSSYKPAFKQKTYSTQRYKTAFKVYWLLHPDLDVPPIISDYLYDLDGQCLSDLISGQNMSGQNMSDNTR